MIYTSRSPDYYEDRGYYVEEEMELDGLGCEHPTGRFRIYAEASRGWTPPPPPETYRHWLHRKDGTIELIEEEPLD